jgi:chorismate mutase
MDLGMKVLMNESHVNPTVALSDSKQQVTPNQLKSIINGLHIREVVADESQNLELQSLRMKMDFIDEQLIELLKGRMDIAESVGEYKRENDLAVLQLERWRDIVKTRMNWSEELGIDREFILKILEQVHKESIRIQTDILNKEQ